jgi:hypothetical protein
VGKFAIAALAVPALGVALVAYGISLSASGSASPAIPPASTLTGPGSGSKVLGTEHVSGVITGAKALANTTVFHLIWAGPVNTAGNWIEPSGPGPEGRLETFTTAAGKVTLEITSSPIGHSGVVNPTACEVEQVFTMDYAVYGGLSTGKWAGAAGSGKVTLTQRGDLPKLKDGHCATPSEAPLTEASAYDSFTGGGPLTVVKS